MKKTQNNDRISKAKMRNWKYELQYSLFLNEKNNFLNSKGYSGKTWIDEKMDE